MTTQGRLDVLAVAFAACLIAGAAWYGTRAPASPRPAERADEALQPERDALSELIARRETLGEFVIVPQRRLPDPLRVERPRVTPVFARDTQFIGTAR
jgi:hypothetical protein